MRNSYSKQEDLSRDGSRTSGGGGVGGNIRILPKFPKEPHKSGILLRAWTLQIWQCCQKHRWFKDNGVLFYLSSGAGSLRCVDTSIDYGAG